MNRRKFLSAFSSLAGVAALPAAALAAESKPKDDIPPGFVKVRCQTEGRKWGPGMERPACGAEFLLPKGAGTYFACPHCGFVQDPSHSGLREAVASILVKEGHPAYRRS